MNINMPENQFDKLTKLCRSSRSELSGIMNAKVHNGEIFIVGAKLDESGIIKSSNSHKIIYNSKEYIANTIYEFAFTNSPVYIRFHTHPTFTGILGLSQADVDNLKYVQILSQTVAKSNSTASTEVIEGIVTDPEIAFYTYDLEPDKPIRLPFFVDRFEKILSTEKSKFQAFKNGFIEGIRKTKR